MLQQLFATDRYAAAEHWLLDRRRAADSAMYGGLDAVADVASRIAAVAGEEPPPDWRERPAMLTEWIQNLAVLAQAKEATAEGRRSSATDVRRGAHEALSAAQALHERQRRHADAVAGLAAHLKAEDRRVESAGRVADARRAEPVTALAAGAGRAREEATHRGALASVALEALTHDRDDELQSDPAQLMLIEAPTLRAQDAWEHSGRRREQAALARRFLDAEAELTAAEAGLRSARVRREARERDLAERTEWIARAEPRLPELRAAVDAARGAAAALPGRKGAADEATRRAEAAIRRDGLRRELMAARAREQDALASANAAREAWLDARERRLSGIAGELAGELRDGEACRVCGSLEHPAPAHGDGEERVDAETERALGEEATGKSSALEQARADCAEHERALAAAVAVAGEDAGDALTAAASQAAAQLRDTQAAAEREQAAVDALDRPRAHAAGAPPRGRRAHRGDRPGPSRAALTGGAARAGPGGGLAGARAGSAPSPHGSRGSRASRCSGARPPPHSATPPPRSSRPIAGTARRRPRPAATVSAPSSRPSPRRCPRRPGSDSRRGSSRSIASSNGSARSPRTNPSRRPRPSRRRTSPGSSGRLPGPMRSSPARSRRRDSRPSG